MPGGPVALQVVYKINGKLKLVNRKLSTNLSTNSSSYILVLRFQFNLTERAKGKL